jgi:hypothetical protein
MTKARAHHPKKGASLSGWMCSENNSTENWLERVRQTE